MTLSTAAVAQVQWIVDRAHVGTPDHEIADDIRRRCNAVPAGAWTPADIRAAVRCALARHHANLSLFAWIDAGLPG